MSGAPIINGTNQLPKPPMVAGMTAKNTMISPCAVMSTFHSWPGMDEGSDPGWDRLARIRTDAAAPIERGDDREDDVERADVLMVGRKQPTLDEGDLVMMLVMRDELSCAGCAS